MKIVTDLQITDAAMELVMEKGYSDMTTKDIARRAGVNEATLFRRLGSKKEIVLKGLQGNRWMPYLDISIFDDATWDLQTDLERFMREYCKRVTPEMVRLSIGLRSPQVYADTAPYIMQVPDSFSKALEGYFEAMAQRGEKLCGQPHALAMTIFAATFGFVFLKASFGQALTALEQDEYIRESVKLFVEGIRGHDL